MALFGKEKCVNCGAEKMGMMLKKMGDGSLICNDCINKLPSILREDILGFGYDTYVSNIAYMEHSANELLPKFKETARYGDLHVDEENQLFYLSDGLFDTLEKNTVIFDMHNIHGYSFDFAPEEVKKGMLSDKVIGDVSLIFASVVPTCAVSRVIKKKAKVKYIQTGVFKKKYNFEFPSDMFAIEEIFNRNMRQIEEENAQIDLENLKNQIRHEMTHNDVDMALATFMFDSIDGLTEEAIKQQRNKLIKAFHPDGGEINNAFSVKINESYEILLSAIRNS